MNNHMWHSYFDASALAKRYTTESGTALVNEAFNLLAREKMYCSTLGLLEVVSILIRKRNDGRLARPLFRQAMAAFKSEVITNVAFQKSSVDDALLLLSFDLLEQHNLNSADTIILRSALNLQQALQLTNEALVLWTSDKRLARAAAAEGLQVFDPEIETIATLQTLFPPTT